MVISLVHGSSSPGPGRGHCFGQDTRVHSELGQYANGFLQSDYFDSGHQQIPCKIITGILKVLKFCCLCNVQFTAPFNNMRTLKFKAQPTNGFFAAVNQEFGGSS